MESLLTDASDKARAADGLEHLLILMMETIHLLSDDDYDGPNCD